MTFLEKNGSVFAARCDAQPSPSPPILLKEVQGGSARDHLRFLQIAFGSSCELQYLIVLVHDLELGPGSNWVALTARCDRVVKQLNQRVERVAEISEG